MAGDFYVGGTLNAIDAKSRVSVPPRFREIVAGRSVERELIVGKSRFDACLIAYDPTYSEKLRAEIEATYGPIDSREKATATRRAFGSRTLLKIDDAHRITLTPGLRNAAGLDRHALFVGMDDRFELWNPQTYLALPDADPELIDEVRQALAAKGEPA